MVPLLQHCELLLVRLRDMAPLVRLAVGCMPCSFRMVMVVSLGMKDAPHIAAGQAR